MVRSQVDKTKMYDPFACHWISKEIVILQVWRHCRGRRRDPWRRWIVGVTFPYQAGRAVRVEIVTDELIAKSLPVRLILTFWSQNLAYA